MNTSHQRGNPPQRCRLRAALCFVASLLPATGCGDQETGADAAPTSDAPLQNVRLDIGEPYVCSYMPVERTCRDFTINFDLQNPGDVALEVASIAFEFPACTTNECIPSATTDIVGPGLCGTRWSVPPHAGLSMWVRYKGRSRDNDLSSAMTQLQWPCQDEPDGWTAWNSNTPFDPPTGSQGRLDVVMFGVTEVWSADFEFR